MDSLGCSEGSINILVAYIQESSTKKLTKKDLLKLISMKDKAFKITTSAKIYREKICMGSTPLS